jgi:ectoine hydroxylase-related dioxygenase (phytanoyl-CoA dioxygenase family)
MTLAEQYQHDGFAVVPTCLSAQTVDQLIEATEIARARIDAQEAVANTSGVYALRNLVDVVPEAACLVSNPEVAELVSAVLGSNAFMVRSTLFDKTEGANWGVFWHQDLSIAVKGRHDVPDYHSWTRKAGVQCVQPPLSIMSNVLAVRLHLDDCFRDNGALKVLPGTHLERRLSSDRIESISTNACEVTCEVPAGGAVLMNPLLLHASSPMNRPGHRRVIHFEFAAIDLPKPLEWRYRIPCVVSRNETFIATT